MLTLCIGVQPWFLLKSGPKDPAGSFWPQPWLSYSWGAFTLKTLSGYTLRNSEPCFLSEESIYIKAICSGGWPNNSLPCWFQSNRPPNLAKVGSISDLASGRESLPKTDITLQHTPTACKEPCPTKSIPLLTSRLPWSRRRANGAVQ